MMTREEAIETLRANYPDACFEQLREAVDKAIKALEADAQSEITDEDVREWCYKRGLTVIDNALYREMWNRWSASVQRWIPCSERLPENSRTVLVTDWGETCVGRRYDGRWWDCDGNVLKDVSAWMPLPEPYEDVEQND